MARNHDVLRRPVGHGRLRWCRHLTHPAPTPLGPCCCLRRRHGLHRVERLPRTPLDDMVPGSQGNGLQLLGPFAAHTTPSSGLTAYEGWPGHPWQEPCGAAVWPASVPPPPPPLPPPLDLGSQRTGISRSFCAAVTSRSAYHRRHPHQGGGEDAASGPDRTRSAHAEIDKNGIQRGINGIRSDSLYHLNTYNVQKTCPQQPPFGAQPKQKPR